jgi:hypothetical protein
VITFCQLCGEPYEDEESDAPEPALYCSGTCQDTEEDLDEDEENVCQQCFGSYSGDCGDGFCSDSCLEEYEEELDGDNTEEE